MQEIEELQQLADTHELSDSEILACFNNNYIEQSMFYAETKADK